MFSALDYRLMQRALELAERGRFTTQPNPRVGCVVAQGERIVGEGWHRIAGDAHAEVLALRAAGDDARGGTAYVTLEPHSFHGKTPPCTDALIRAGVKRVVCGVLDPNPKVHGEGMRQLAVAGITAEVGLLADEIRELNLGFERRMVSGIPRITVKIAASVDGRVALANGESRWITSAAARSDVQRLRAQSSAVLTGIGTVIADDPQLNVRDPALDLGGRQPLRVILDSKLRMSPTAKLFRAPGKVLIATCANPRDAGAVWPEAAEFARIPDTDGRVALRALLHALARRECNDVLVEAGPTLSSRFLTLRLCDELIVYQAPLLLGSRAKPMFDGPVIERLADGLQFDLFQVQKVGPDLKLTLRPRVGAVP